MNGFEKSKRLLTPEEYSAVFAQVDEKISVKGLVLLAKKNNLPNARLGLAIKRKDLPLSVQRNRLKRRIRESFRLNAKTLLARDIVIITSRGISQISKEQLCRALEEMWIKLRKTV